MLALMTGHAVACLLLSVISAVRLVSVVRAFVARTVQLQVDLRSPISGHSANFRGCCAYSELKPAKLIWG